MLRKAAVLLLLGIAAITGCVPPQAVLPSTAGVIADVRFLANYNLEGRATGSRGSDRAAAFIVQRYKSLGVAGAFPGACGDAVLHCDAEFLQPFAVAQGRAKNVGAIIPGTDSVLRNEYVVVGAHYDHIGHSPYLSLDPEAGDATRPGADDNASGTAAVLEIARRFAAHPARRSLLLLHFDAEELGLLGSMSFVARTPVPTSRMRIMVNLDMVGRLASGALIVDAPPRRAGGITVRGLVDSVSGALGLKPRYSTEIEERSDHASFRNGGVPAIALFTGFHADYHRVTDVPRKIDARGIEQVADLTEGVLRSMADR